MKKISSISYNSMIFSLSGAGFFGILSTFIINKASNYTIYSLILGFIISLLLSKIILKLFDLKQDKTINEKFDYAFNKLSIIINIIYILITIAFLIIINYRLASFIVSQYLTSTSKLLLLSIVYFLTSYIATKDIETITRVSVIVLVISLSVFLFDFSSLVSYSSIDNILPIVISNKLDFIKSTITFSLFFITPTFYINTIKKNDIVDKERFNKYYNISLLISFIILFISITLTISIYGYNLCKMFDYPLYTVLKRITLFSYIDSVENISVSLWILYIIIASTMFMFSIICSIKHTFKIRNNNIISLIISIICIILTYILLMNNNYIENFNFIYITAYICGLLLFIGLITIIKIKSTNKSTS